MDGHQMTNEEIRQKFKQLEQLLKQKRHRRSRHFSSSLSKVESHIEALCAPSCKRRERRSHKAKQEHKIYKHNVNFPKYNGDSNPNVYEEWERK